MRNEARLALDNAELQYRAMPTLPGTQEKIAYLQHVISGYNALIKRIPERQKWLEEMERMPAELFDQYPEFKEVLELCQWNKPKAEHSPTLFGQEQSASTVQQQAE
jgi:hypothetical protein